VWKFTSNQINKYLALWLVSFLNSNLAYQQIKELSKILQRGDIKFSISRLETLFVPDYDYYLKDRPERVQVYLKWVEDNITDKDKFLAGIDEQFKELIR
jgi:hypothetical protein